MTNEKSWLHFSLICLLITMLLGLLLRLSFAGFPVKALGSLDLRQAHSHLGYYGFLFPMIWSWLQGRGLWIPEKKWAYAYISVVFLSTISFLLYGYSPSSHGLSGLVLAVWLVFAFKNYKVHSPLSRDWLGSVPLSITFAAVAVFSVAVVTVIGFENTGEKLVRSFLTILAYGVFLPIVLDRKALLPFPVWVWFLSILGLAGFVTDLVAPIYFLWAPLLVSFLLLYVLLKSWSRPQNILEFRFYFYMVSLALGLIFFGLGWLPNTHFVAIAGLHFLILGPLLGLFISFRQVFFYLIYDVFVLLMVLFLILMWLVPESILTWQLMAAFSGVPLFLMVGVSLLWPATSQADVSN